MLKKSCPKRLINACLVLFSPFFPVDQIPLNVATETFARHGLSSPLCSEGCDGRVMDVAQMVNCLTTLYCRVWDALANQPDVVKTIDTSAGVVRSGMPAQQSPTKSCTSESTLAGTNGQQTVN